MFSHNTMSKDQFCVSWVSYKNYISQGFARLQQEGEFVDMTLAADGHLVKVHQNIVALASPYIKAMIQSAACPHPVVFLNNINQNILSFILEYIYTGEVKIPTDVVPTFIQACKALCIKGVENLDFPQKNPDQLQPESFDVPPASLNLPPAPLNLPPAPMNLPPAPLNLPPAPLNLPPAPMNLPPAPLNLPPAPMNLPPVPLNLPPAPLDLPPERPRVPSDNNFAAHITINSENYNVEVIPADNNMVHETTQPYYSLGDIDLMNFQALTNTNTIGNQNIQQIAPLPNMEIVETDFEYLDAPHNGQENQTEILNSNYYTTATNTTVAAFNLDTSYLAPPPPPSVSKITHETVLGKKANTLHYSITKRGSLQILLNQYMYNCHHHSFEGSKRRWRCTDYRKLHCPAYLDTANDAIVKRCEDHNHGQHKTQILRKYKSKCIFTSITQAQNRMTVKEKPKSKPKKFVRTTNTSRRANQIIKVSLHREPKS